MASTEGMKLAKEAQVMTERMRDGVITAPAPTDQVQGGAQAVQFQKKFAGKDKFDDEMNTKMQLMDETGMTPFGQVYYDDKVGRWLERKAAVSEAANFDSYFNREFNKNDLASRQWAQQIHPDFYKAREDEMNERAEIVLRLKKIQLRGPQDKQDLYMLWLIESGRVQLPPDWDTIGPAYHGTTITPAVQKENERRYNQGLIRMPLFLTNLQRADRASGNAGAGAWGDRTQARNYFNEGEPPAVSADNNVPLSKHGAGFAGRTMGFNFQNFLRQGQ